MEAIIWVITCLYQQATVEMQMFAVQQSFMKHRIDYHVHRTVEFMQVLLYNS